MYPQFEKTKIIDGIVYCNVGNSLVLNSFGFGYKDINNIKINKQVSIFVNNVRHTRVCSLIYDLERNLYLRFKQISNDFHDDMICQFFYKSRDFECASCGEFYQGQHFKKPCCSMKSNIIIMNDCEIYQINFLSTYDFMKKKTESKNEFLDLHFGSIIDTIILGDPV